MNETNEKIIEFKIILLGPINAGKTCFMHRLINNKFIENCPSSKKFSNYNKIITINKQKIIFEIWDSVSFVNLPSVFYKGANWVILIYRIRSKNNFYTLESWIKILEEEETLSGIPIFLVCNKIDDEDNREVSKEQGEKSAKKYGFTFSECSVKDGVNVDDIFNKLAEYIYYDFKNNEKCKENLKILKKYIYF